MIPDFNMNNDDDFVEMPEDEWKNISRWFGTNVSMSGLVLTEWEMIRKNRKNGSSKTVCLGIPAAERLIKGIFPGETVYIGQGDERINSAIALNMIRNLGVQGQQRMLIFNTTRGAYSLARGLMSLCSGVDENAFQNAEMLSEEDCEKIEVAVRKINTSDLSIVSTPNVSVEAITEEVKKLNKNELPDLILIDSLHFLIAKKKFKNREQEYRYIAKKLQQLARQSKIPIVLTGPLSSRRRGMRGYWPTVADMPADSMADCFDKILMLDGTDERKNAFIFQVSVVKNPDGEMKSCQLLYRPKCNELLPI